MNTLIIISCICMLFVFGRIFIVPIKWIFKLAVNSALGAILIWIINLIGGMWGFHIGLNICTSILVRPFGCAWSDTINFDYAHAVKKAKKCKKKDRPQICK